MYIVKEHKKKVAEKLQHMTISPVSRPVSHAYPPPEDFVGGFVEEEEEYAMPVPVQRYTAQLEKTRLRQLLNCKVDVVMVHEVRKAISFIHLSCSPYVYS